jgi:hypothetical protein
MADDLRLCIVRPPSGASGARYCNVKVVAPAANVPEMFQTFWWTPDGRPLTLERVRAWSNFRITPFVEIEDVFVNRAVRSIQLKLRECIVTPPAERVTVRTSLAFADRVCGGAADADGADEPPAKRARAPDRPPVDGPAPEASDEDDDDDDDA